MDRTTARMASSTWRSTSRSHPEDLEGRGPALVRPLGRKPILRCRPVVRQPPKWTRTHDQVPRRPDVPSLRRPARRSPEHIPGPGPVHRRPHGRHLRGREHAAKCQRLRAGDRGWPSAGTCTASTRTTSAQPGRSNAASWRRPVDRDYCGDRRRYLPPDTPRSQQVSRKVAGVATAARAVDAHGTMASSGRR